MSVAVLLGALLVAQGTAPLRKSDLVRLLSTSEITSTELTQLVLRNCLTFDPTERDRNDLRLMGADAATIAAVDECARRKTARRTVVVAPARRRSVAPPAAPPPPAPAAPPAVMQVQRIVVRASPERSTFVAGGGQRGMVGTQLPRAIVFEVRDSAGTAIAGQAVTFTAINARVQPVVTPSDAAGQARAGVTLGERVGSATVIASIGVVEKQVAFNVIAGPATQLAVLCGSSSVSGHIAIRPDSQIALQVSAQDGFGNVTPLLGLRAAVADARIFHVERIAQDSVSGSVVLKPEQAGTTSLAVIANGMRQYLTVTVPPRAAPGKVDCR